MIDVLLVDNPPLLEFDDCIFNAPFSIDKTAVVAFLATRGLDQVVSKLPTSTHRLNTTAITQAATESIWKGENEGFMWRFFEKSDY